MDLEFYILFQVTVLHDHNCMKMARYINKKFVPVTDKPA